MRWYRLLLWIAIFAVGFPALANADPVSTAIVTWVASAAFAASTAGAIVIGALDLAISAGLSYVAKALAGKPKNASLGVQGTLQGGGVVPRSFIAGYGSTSGSLCYRNTYGTVDKTPNAYYVEIIALSDLPVSSLEQVWVYDTLVTYGSGTPDASLGYAIPEYNLSDDDHLWIKFHDGTQTAADSYLTSKFGSDPNFPYDSGRVGTGVAYVVITARINAKLFSGWPTFHFACNGAKLYDPRSDSTNGGSGSQRFSDASTWAFTLNPMVVLYNVLRGLYYAGDWFYGLQSLTAKRLPTASWFAAMNECDLSVDTNAGGTEAQYRCGGEIAVDVQPADAMDGLLMACNGRVAEIGGIYKAQAGASGSSVLSFTDSDLLTTDQQTFDQFPALTDLVNGITASYPEPTQEWASTDAPALYSADYEAADGDRRLISDVSYDLVPFAEQVQRLMKSALAEARRFRKHVLPFPSDGWSLEPLDVVSWTSARNGYSAKAFRCDVVTDRDNLDLILAITEVDPADYDWDASTDYQAFSLGTLTLQRPGPQTLSGWSLAGVAVDGDNGLQIPGLELQWDTDVDDVNGVQFQIRLAADSSIAIEGETDHWDTGSGIITQNLVRNTAYQGRARYRSLSSRDFDWTDWLDASTPDIRWSALDIYNNAINEAHLDTALQDDIAQITANQERIAGEITSRLSSDAIIRGLQGDVEKAATALLGIQLIIPQIEQTYQRQLVAYVQGITGSDVTDFAARLIVVEGAVIDLEAGSATASDLHALDSQINTPGTGLSATVSNLAETVALLDPSSATATLSETVVAVRGHNIALDDVGSTLLNVLNTLNKIQADQSVSLAFFRNEITSQVTDGISATAQAIGEVSSVMVSGLQQAQADILTVQDTSASASDAVATLSTTVLAALGTLTDPGAIEAAISTEASARVSGDSSNASSITSVSSSLGRVNASGFASISTATTPGDAQARIAFSVSASSGATPKTASFFLDALSDGTSRAIFSVDKFLITDGTNLSSPFLFSGGSLFVKSAVIPNISADIITTGSLDASLITAGTLNVGALTVTGTFTAANLAVGAANVVAQGSVLSGTVGASYSAIDTLSVSYAAGARHINFKCCVVLSAPLSGNGVFIQMVFTGGVLGGQTVTRTLSSSYDATSTAFNVEIPNYSTSSETLSCAFSVKANTGTISLKAFCFAEQSIR